MTAIAAITSIAGMTPKPKTRIPDPAWRGDFQGLIDKLDYIKALGFSAIWITPVVENASGYDYHGYHAIDFTQVDPRLESEGATFQDLIDAAHDKGMKIIQDIVLNHSGNFARRISFRCLEKTTTKPTWSTISSPLILTRSYPKLRFPEWERPIRVSDQRHENGR
jgi:pullulanase/glycogen debranching enzyme